MIDAPLMQTKPWPVSGLVAGLLFSALLSLSPMAVVYAASAATDAGALVQGSLRVRYPENAWTSLEQTDRALNDAALERNLAEAAFEARRRECYKHFFATACLNKAKEERRIRLAVANSVQIEAERYRRELRAKEREQAHKEDEEQRVKEAAAEAAQAAANARAYEQRLADHARAQSEREAEQAPSPSGDPATRERLLKEREAAASKPQQSSDVRKPARRAAEYSVRLKASQAEQARRQQAEAEGEAARLAKSAQQAQKIKAAEERQAKLAKRRAEQEAARERKRLAKMKEEQAARTANEAASKN